MAEREGAGTCGLGALREAGHYACCARLQPSQMMAAHPKAQEGREVGRVTLDASAAPSCRRVWYACSLGTASSMPQLLKPIRFTIALCSGMRKHLGEGLPGCGCGGIDPASHMSVSRSCHRLVTMPDQA